MKNFSKTILLFTLFSFLVTSHSFAETNTQCHDNVYVCRVKEMWARMSGGKTPTTIEKPKPEKETVITPDPKETPTELNKLLTPDQKTQVAQLTTPATQPANVPDRVFESSATFAKNDAVNKANQAAYENFLKQKASPGYTAPSTPNNGAASGGEFVCTKNNGGTLNGGAKDCKPKKEGGQIEDELYFAVKNAAEVSGARVDLVSCLRPGAKIAGTDKDSMHGFGKALDLKPIGTDTQKKFFILAVLANTDKYNSVGSYKGETHTHIGADKGELWTSFLKDIGFPPLYKIAAFLAAGVQHSDKSKTKKYISDQAKKILPQQLGANCK